MLQSSHQPVGHGQKHSLGGSTEAKALHPWGLSSSCGATWTVGQGEPQLKLASQLDAAGLR